MAAPKGNKFALGNKGGRPTKYHPDIIAMIDEYLAWCDEEHYKEVVERYDENQKPISTKLMLQVRLPSNEGFSEYIDVCVDTLSEWRKEHKEFSAALKKIKTRQHNRYINNGLAGTYNPTIAKLGLMSNHGYKERSKNEDTVTMNFDKLVDQYDEEEE